MSERVLGGRYRIEEVLGRGGMAEVFKGTDTVLGRPVAIKVLAPQYAQDDGFVSRFRREAQAAARLNHPNLVGVYDTGSDDGTHYIVMEYVEGRTLAEFLAGGGRLMPERAIELAESVCRALDFAHRQGVIHRDIKPGNIMVTRQGEVKVMDFGIARLTSSAETIAQTAAVLGTAAYLSPEQARGEPVDARSDLYSLGVVLFEMVTGKVPFTGDSAVTVAYKHVQEPPEPPSKLNPDVSPELEAVVMRALAKNPANRYQSAEEFRRDLKRARHGEPVEATPLLPEAATEVIPRRDRTQALPPVRPPHRARRWVVGIVVALVVLGGIGAGMYVLAQTILKTETKMVKVPPVTTLPLEQATSLLESFRLKVDVTKRVDPATPGTVLEQDPLPGTKVKPGSTVNLVIAKPAPKVTVPNLTDMTEDAARAALEKKGLLLGQVNEEASSSVDVGHVISQNPVAGSPVDEGTPVEIWISTGPGTVLLPDVTCLAFSVAKNKLDLLGFNVVFGGTAPANPICPQPNKVAVQDPSGPSEQPEGTTVTLYTSEPGPSPTPTPSPT